MDGLRGLAAIGVVAVHVWMYTDERESPSPLVDGAIGELRLGLMFFFVVSGFLLAGPWVRAALEDRAAPSLRRFTQGRLRRVLPAYLVALAGAFAVLHGTGHPRAVGWEALPLFAVFAQNQVESTAGQLNPPTWSLSVEMTFYALLPVLGALFLRARTRARMLAVCGAAVAVGLAWCAIAYEQRWPFTATTSLPTYLPVFACGIAACVLSAGRRPGPRTALALLAAGWAAVVVCGWWHARGDTGLAGHTFRDVPAAAGFAAIAVGLCARPPGLLDLWPIRQLGVISYGLYLWHMPVLYWLKTRGMFADAFLPAYATVVLPAIALGAASWLAVERPFLRPAARRRGDRARRPVAASA
ncbi:MAG TPA: acyltransferase [Baekduia sp.]|nr:acyltransferase [Baekduia sp.]